MKNCRVQSNKAVAIRCSPKSEFFKSLSDELKNLPGVQLELIENMEEMRSFPTIFIPLEHIAKLINVLPKEQNHNAFIDFAIQRPVATGSILGALAIGVIVVASIFTCGVAGALVAASGATVGLSGGASMIVASTLGFFAGASIGAGAGLVIDKFQNRESDSDAGILGIYSLRSQTENR